jgi:hypothetical protein
MENYTTTEIVLLIGNIILIIAATYYYVSLNKIAKIYFKLYNKYKVDTDILNKDYDDLFAATQSLIEKHNTLIDVNNNLVANYDK